jgi:cytochrome c556
VRLIVLFLIGLAVGAAGTLIAITALNRQTAWDHATMAVIGQQMKAMDQALKANRCTTGDFAPRLQTMRLVANDIEAAFADEVENPQFNRYAADLRAAADAALAAPPATCKAASATMSNLGKTCDNCHREFRG